MGRHVFAASGKLNRAFGYEISLLVGKVILLWGLPASSIWNWNKLQLDENAPEL